MIYKYPIKRWFTLLIFMFLSVVIQLQWLTHAPISRVAEVFYGDQLLAYSFLSIDSLAVVYMFVFLALCLPASYFIDTYGIKKGIGLGAILTIIGVLIKGLSGHSFITVFIGQAILAAAQPFILNGVTAFSLRWFPINERAIVAGLLALAQYIGILLAMLITPMLVGSVLGEDNYGTGIDKMLLIYMIPTIIAAVLILLFLQEKPKDLPHEINNERLNFKKGILHMLKLKDAILILIIFTIGLGIFNAVSSLVDSISANLNIKDSDGLIGGLMIIGGIIGAIIIPILSDYFLKRKLFLVLCLALAAPALTGLAYAVEISSFLELNSSQTYNFVLASSFLLGMSIMSAGPIGFQYTAEITSPTPESTSQGILLLVGQISGIAMVTLMSINNNEYLDLMMKMFVPLTVVAFILILFTKESKVIRNQ